MQFYTLSPDDDRHLKINYDGDAGSKGHGPLLQLLWELRRLNYAFVPPTPATYARLHARRGRARDLRDVFGWSLPFTADVVSARLIGLLEEAGQLETDGPLLRSRVRVSRLDGQLFIHSAYPTDDKDAVFLGPDSYRFARLIRTSLGNGPAPRCILDLGAGAGVGGLVAGALYPQARVVLADVNRKALDFARVNAALAERAVETLAVDAGAHEMSDIDLALTNPPFMIDPQQRAYRNGGEMHGAKLALDWTLYTAPRLAPGAMMLLYTGSAIVDGRDALAEALDDALPQLGCTMRYEDVDPDIFGEELDQPAYAGVERIAAVAALIVRER